MSYELKKQKFLSDAEYDRLESRLKDLAEHEPRNCALVLLAMYTGARASELLGIRPEDLDRVHHSVYIRGLKNSDDRDIPLPKWLFKTLTRLPQDGEYLFPISYPRLDQIWRQIRTTKKKFHSLRHTFALRLYKRTKDVYLVKTALGHRDISNTMIYVNFAFTQTEMRRLVVEE